MAGVREQNLQPKGYENITGLSVVKGVTLTGAAAGTRYLLLKTETQPVRWRDDGTDPTAALGILIDVGDEFWYTGDPSAIKFIETAVSASLHVAKFA
ncbi:MAG: hypothetical protein ACT4PO_02605 [Actinomycetota bacterium]